jgi:hypothetical protein
VGGWWFTVGEADEVSSTLASGSVVAAAGADLATPRHRKGVGVVEPSPAWRGGTVSRERRGGDAHVNHRCGGHQRQRAASVHSYVRALLRLGSLSLGSLSLFFLSRLTCPLSLSVSRGAAHYCI